MLKHNKTRLTRTLTKHSLTGFTLLEVMVVIVIVGLMASVIQFNFNGNNPDKIIEKESQRFSAIFNLAAEYGMLNNVELGLLVEDNTYQFLGFDGEQWTAITLNKQLDRYTVPEGIRLSLSLDDLPLDEPPLINVLKENEESNLAFSGSELEEEKLIPQVYILSGGDLTPFILQFIWTDSVEPLSYLVSGLYSTPLMVKGPISDE